MSADSLDELDKEILHLLQIDARNTSPVDMAEQLPVTDTTIRNRIEDMEDRGIIEGYEPRINYEQAGFPLRVKFICTAPIQERSSLAEKALELANVVQVEEMLTARENVRILVVTREAEELNQVSSDIDSLGLSIEKESLVRRTITRPFNHFGTTEPGDE